MQENKGQTPERLRRDTDKNKGKMERLRLGRTYQEERML